MRIDETRPRSGGIRILQIGFDDEEGAGLTFTGIRVHENGGLVAFHQGIGEIKATDAEIGDTNAVREGAAGEDACNFDAESIVTHEDVADSGDQDPFCWAAGVS